MKYLRVRWLHENSNDPVTLCSEIDEDGWEKRKIEIFAGGRMGFAPPGNEGLRTTLSIEPIPPIDEIGQDSQFQTSWIAKEEFEALWMNHPEPTKGELNRID